MKVFSIFDSKAEAYLPPLFEMTKGVAIRRFTAAVQNEDSEFCKHAPDFTLFEIGEWDEQTGTLTSHEAKISLGCAVEYLNTDNGV